MCWCTWRVLCIFTKRTQEKVLFLCILMLTAFLLCLAWLGALNKGCFFHNHIGSSVFAICDTADEHVWNCLPLWAFCRIPAVTSALCPLAYLSKDTLFNRICIDCPASTRVPQFHGKMFLLRTTAFSDVGRTPFVSTWTLHAQCKREMAGTANC